MVELSRIISDHEDWLMERVLGYASARGYTAYTSILKEAWRLSIHGLSEALLRAIPGGLASMELGPEDVYTDDAASIFAVQEAHLHRARGVSLGMFLGLLKYYRQSYLDLLQDVAMDHQERSGAKLFVERFFDRVEVGIASEWCALSEPQKLGELQETTRLVVNEKNRYKTLFETLGAPVLFINRKGLVQDLNLAAVEWLGHMVAVGEVQCLSRLLQAEGVLGEAAYLGQAVGKLLPWLQDSLERMLVTNEPGMVFDQRLGQGEAARNVTVMLSSSIDITKKFDGIVVVVQDVTALHAAREAQERLAVELKGKLREAASLNRLAEVLNVAGNSAEEIMHAVVTVLPGCWSAPGVSFAATATLDGHEYASGDSESLVPCGATLEVSLNLLGQERGVLRLCNQDAAHSFQPGDASMLSVIATQVEHVLEAKFSLNLLSQSERQFRELFDNAPDAFFIHDETGRILDANKVAGIWLNAPTGSLPGTSLLESVAESERELTTGRFLNALRGTPDLFQATLQRRDGFTIPAELLCQRLEYHGRPALMTIGRNIAERLRAQAEIERRLEMEGAVSTISGRLINSTDEDMAEGVEESLTDLSRFLGMPWAGIYLLDEKKKSLVLTFRPKSAVRADEAALLKRITKGKMPWFTERIMAGERVFLRDAAHMPPAGRREKALLGQMGIVSLVAVPLTVKDRLLGVLALASNTPQDTSRLAGSRLLEQAKLLFSNAIDRRKTAVALRQSESLARAILDALPANICVLDKCGMLTMVNRSWAANGPASTPLGNVGVRLGLGDNYLEECRKNTEDQHVVGTLNGILAVLGGKAAFFTIEYPTRVGGEVRWHVLQATPFAKGMAGAVVSHRDITDRMRAVVEMRESEERFRIIVETAQEAVVKIDPSQRIIYCNPRASTMFGYEQQELLGLSLIEILDPEDHALLQQKVKRRRQGYSDQYELRFRHKSGRRIWTMLNASPLSGLDGSFAGSIGLITDITDRMRAEARLRRNEALYRSLVESMHEGLLMARRGGGITYANARFCAMLGRKKAEFTGRPISAFVDEGSKKRLAKMLSESKTQGHLGGSEEILWEHASGRHIYSLVSPSLYADEDGKDAGFFAVITDTTERKGLEFQLLQSQKLEAIGQLAAGIAHEINTPAQYVGNNVQFIKGAFEDMNVVLTALRGFITASRTACPGMEQVLALEALVVDRDIEYLVGEVPNAVAQTLEGVERISTIVRSVKQFAHPGAAVMASADLNESMRSTVTVSRNEWKYVAELALDLDPTLPMVVCMIGEINQVVLNLIINAAHAIADAKKLNPEREGRITLTTGRVGPWAEIRVTDTGTGIPVAVQTKIFDPFFTTKEVGRGTGQGLTISRSIVVEKHKGQLFFETQEGTGTTFVVRLPVDPADGHEAA